MFQILADPFRRPLDQLPSNVRLQPVLNMPFKRRNGSWQQEPGADTQKTVQSLALAAAGTATLWTVGAGSCLYLEMLSISATVSGRYSITYAAVNIWDGLLLANTTVMLAAGAGVYLYPAASVLRVVNNTAGVADVYGTAWGTEVLA